MIKTDLFIHLTVNYSVLDMDYVLWTLLIAVTDSNKFKRFFLPSWNLQLSQDVPVKRKCHQYVVKVALS